MTALNTSRARTAVLTAACFLILAAAFFARTTGIHIDESNYLKVAWNAPYGDSPLTGKPALFYAFNYLFLHSLGFAFGPLRPLSLHLFYIGLFIFLAGVGGQPGRSEPAPVRAVRPGSRPADLPARAVERDLADDGVGGSTTPHPCAGVHFAKQARLAWRC
ncbi:MAG: hypothetical protein ABI868_13160 [Acidobacteriota bacterium]